MITRTNFQIAAELLGWQWSHAHGGYINESHRRQGGQWSDYQVAETAEDACFIDGIETDMAAMKLVADHAAPASN